MPVAKLRASNMMKSEGHDSLDTYIRQGIGKENFLSFPRTVDSPVQWIQLLNAFDQQDLPGWPLPPPLKVQMQKCDKCSWEFCSPINYRRHIRMHRRSLNVDKDSHKHRDLLGAFWDKLSLDVTKEILSFKDVTLEEVPGSSIISALTSFIHRPGFCAFPQVYLKAGSALLDIILARPSRLPISSQDLFSILDDASERTFLCAGAAKSMQKYVFDGEAGKIGLEMKNLVACTSFLIEQKLVKAWLADKDAEALRCQKLLVEEEEAAQKRQAELLERKRQKKLRQKEHRVKEQANSEGADLKDATADTLDIPPSAETSIPSGASESILNALETLVDHTPSILVPVQILITKEDEDTEAQFGFSSEHSPSGTFTNFECQTAQGSSHRHLVISRWQVPKTRRGRRNGFHASQNPQELKLQQSLRDYDAPRDPRAAPIVGGNKVWTRKPKSENEGESLKSKSMNEAVDQTGQNKNCAVMIGSISVTLGNPTDQQKGDGLAEGQEHCGTEHALPTDSGQDKPTKTDSFQGGLNRSTVKLWRPVNRHKRDPMPVQIGSGESGEDARIDKGNDQTVPSESCLRSCTLDDNNYECGNDSHALVDESLQPEGLLFSRHAAKAFLAQRWKDAAATDHVKLVLSPECIPPGCPNILHDGQVDPHRHSIFGNAENQLDNARAFKSSTTGTLEVKFRTKLERG